MASSILPLLSMLDNCLPRFSRVRERPRLTLAGQPVFKVSAWVELFLDLKKLRILVGCHINFCSLLNYTSEILFHYLNLGLLKNEI